MLMASNTPYLDETSVVTHFKIKDNCIFVNGNGLLSATGLIENAAQACTAIVGQSYFAIDDFEGKGNKLVGYISAIKNVQVHELPNVGDTLVTNASLISRYDTGNMTLCTVTSSTFRNDDLIVACTFNFLIQEVE